MKNRKQLLFGTVKLAIWLGSVSVLQVEAAGGRLSIGGPAATMAGRTGVKLSVKPETLSTLETTNDIAQQDLIKVHELASGSIRWTGAKSAGDLAPESQVVGVSFGEKAVKAPTLSGKSAELKSAGKNSTKQSQDFETHQNQVGSSSRPVEAEEVPSARPTVPVVFESTTATSTAVQTSATSPRTTSTTTIGTPPGWPNVPERPPSSTTTAAAATTTTTTEAPRTSEGPVGTRVDREGDAVLCGEANANGKSNRRLITDRIVGGHKTEPGEFPFQVRLNIRSRRGSGICGGVVIDQRHVLTAAHCMTACVSHQLTTATIESSGVKVTVGDHSIKSDDGEIELDAEKITPHEKYDACNFYANDHDIALIKTAGPIPFKFTTDGYGSVNRPCMPQSNEVQYRDGEPVIVSGWGVTRENSGALSNILRFVQVPVVNVTRCQETYGNRVTQDHVCAGFQAGGKDSCQGDSGGPLVRVVDNRYELVGIVSFGYGCGQAGAAGVYTKVASYLDWIKTNASDL